MEFSVFSQGKRVRIVLGSFYRPDLREPTSILVIFHWPELPHRETPHLRDTGKCSPVVCQRKQAKGSRKGSQTFMGTAGLCYRHCAGHSSMIRRSGTSLAVRIL